MSGVACIDWFRKSRVRSRRLAKARRPRPRWLLIDVPFAQRFPSPVSQVSEAYPRGARRWQFGKLPAKLTEVAIDGRQ